MTTVPGTARQHQDYLPHDFQSVPDARGAREARRSASFAYRYRKLMHINTHDRRKWPSSVRSPDVLLRSGTHLALDHLQERPVWHARQRFLVERTEERRLGRRLGRRTYQRWGRVHAGTYCPGSSAVGAGIRRRWHGCSTAARGAATSLLLAAGTPATAHAERVVPHTIVPTISSVMSRTRRLHWPQAIRERRRSGVGGGHERAGTRASAERLNRVRDAREARR